MRFHGVRWRFRHFVWPVTLALVLAACGSSGSNGAGGGEPDPDATLRLQGHVASSLDPTQAPEPIQVMVATWPTYDRLLQVTEDAEYAPMLATEWEFSEDGTSLHLTLREGVTFSDGEPFNAEAVRANIEFYKNAESVTSDSHIDVISDAEVLGEYEIALHLQRPTTTILNTLAVPTSGAMISPEALKNPGELATMPVGTGAYVLESFQPGQQVVYTRRTDDGIWDPETGKVARIELAAYDSQEARQNALRSGQVDVIQAGDDASQLQTEIDTGRLTKRSNPTALTMVGMYLNRDAKPFDDPKVRQAVNHAIDRAAVVEALGTEDMSPRVQPFPQGLPGFDPSLEDRYPYDPGKAKELLAEAGFPDGFDGGEFLVGAAELLPDIAEAVQGYLAEVGITIDLRTMDLLQVVTEYGASGASGQFMYITNSSLDPSMWLNKQYQNPHYMPEGVPEALEPLLEGLDDASLSDEEREDKVEAVNTQATENAYYAPILQGVAGYLVTDEVQGLDPGELPFTPFGAGDFRYAWLSK